MNAQTDIDHPQFAGYYDCENCQKRTLHKWQVVRHRFEERPFGQTVQHKRKAVCVVCNK